MEHELFCNVTFNSESKILNVDRQSSYIDFLTNVLSSWPQLRSNVENLSFSWSVGSISNCKLFGDDDLKNLISVCHITSQKIVSVSVSQKTQNPNLCHSVDIQPLMHSPKFVNSSQNSFIAQPSNRIPFKCVKKTRHIPQSLNVDHIPTLFNDSESSSHEHDVEPVSLSFPSVPISPTVEFQPTPQPVEFDGKSNVPSYDVCPTIANKPLLSDSWSQLLNGGIGQEFRGGADEFRCALIKYSTQLEFKFTYVRNDRKYIHAVCEESKLSECDWFIKGKYQAVTEYFIVYKANFDHKCVGNLIHNHTSRMSPKIMSEFVIQTIRTKPTSGGKEIIDILNDHYGLTIPYWKAWRTVEAARDHIFGSYEDSYDQLRWYCSAIERTNPGSAVLLEPNPKSNRFERVFIAFKACIDGFQSCRPMLFIDGTFMKGRAKGTLLSATAKDGDNGLFPVAFAIVSSENTKNWIWFLEKLRDYIHHSKQVFYISDRHCGLMAAFPLVFQEPVHFFCLFHLLTNLKGKFSKGWSNKHRSKMGDYFRDCAYAPTVRLFEEKIAIFKEVGGRIAEEWLESLPFDKWVVAYSPHITRYGEMTSNAAESFNSWISDSRGLPITYMIDSIRQGISRWHLERRKKSAQWTGALCPTKEKWWNHLTNKGRTWKVIECPGGDFEVRSTPSVRVDLRNKSCSCCQWKVRGFPCSHAVAVIRKNSPNVCSYVEECFWTTKYRDCYMHVLHPIPESERYECQDLGPDAKILPPKLNRPPGRPKKRRLPSYGEQPKIKPTVCPRCFKLGKHDTFCCLLSDDSFADTFDEDINWFED